MTLQVPLSPPPVFQRARGSLSIEASGGAGDVSRLKRLRQEGSYRAIFPRSQRGNLEAVLINTAGGVTGGDRFSTQITAGENARITMTYV